MGDIELLGGLLGGTKKEYNTANTVTYGQTYHQPLEHYAPQNTYSPQYAYEYIGATYIINSPNADATKKQAMTASQTTSPRADWDFTEAHPITTTPSLTGGASDTGSTLVLLGIVVTVGIVGYLLVSAPKAGGK